MPSHIAAQITYAMILLLSYNHAIQALFFYILLYPLDKGFISPKHSGRVGTSQSEIEILVAKKDNAMWK